MFEFAMSFTGVFVIINTSIYIRAFCSGLLVLILLGNFLSLVYKEEIEKLNRVNKVVVV